MGQIFNKIVYFRTLKSTNDYLINLYKKHLVKNNFIVVSKYQKQGRGRIGKMWFSDSNSITFSFSIQLTKDLSAWQINMAVSLALNRVLKGFCVQSLIKYPNDIIVKSQKIAGILTEVISVKQTKWCIVGVGVNVNNMRFPVEIPHAISLKQILLKSINQNTVFDNFFSELESLLIQKRNLQKNYLLDLYGGGEFVACLYKGNFVSVKILSISNDGLLKISTKDSSIKIVKDEDVKFVLS
tara:strand:+ start:8025 stop:8744 length:720 start_codon:yes stop_codon:yes gene_type:complete